jgi:hypothetical protein
MIDISFQALVPQVDSMSESYESIYHSNCDDSKYNVQTFIICLFFIAQ